MKQLNLLEENISKLFFRFLWPAISATLVTSIYILVDTIIIGKGIGPDAVAALNLVLPLFNLFFGTGLLFGVGGSVLMSFSKGSGNEKKANAYFSAAVVGLIIIMIGYMLIFNLFLEPILKFLGATQSSLPYVLGYGRTLALGLPVFMTSSFLQTFVRNDKAPKLAMASVITGGVINIILDIIFVYPLNMGMFGAAFASVIGIFFTCTILLSHFFTKKNTLHFSLKSVKLSSLRRIFRSGISSFLIEVSSGIVIFFFNIQLLKYAGEIGVTAYSIISNTCLVVVSLNNGISQAVQPIIATNYGANKLDRVYKTKQMGLIGSILIGTTFMLFALFAPTVLIHLFINPSASLLAFSEQAIKIYAIAFLGMSINLFISNYFQSILMNNNALILCLLRGLLLNIILVYLLPAIFGTTGIWVAIPIVETITIIVAFIMMKKQQKIELTH